MYLHAKINHYFLQSRCLILDNWERLYLCRDIKFEITNYEDFKQSPLSYHPYYGSDMVQAAFSISDEIMQHMMTEQTKRDREKYAAHYKANGIVFNN
jgi:hypothetical protein